MRISLLYILLITLILHSCKSGNNQLTIFEPAPGCEYASFFGIKEERDGIKILINPFGRNSADSLSSWLVLPSDKDYKRIVCMSTSHISYIDALGESNRIVGVSGGQYVSSEVVKKGLNEGSISDIGFEGSLNYELLISLQPDLVLTYGIEGENNQYIEKIKQFNIPVIALGDYLENHPLGKLEYLKLFGQLLNKRDLADSIYNSTKLRYLELKELTKNRNKTNILINAPWKEVWYIPGKNSYMNIIIEDAGGRVLGSTEKSAYTKALSIEEVFILSSNADIWLNPNSIATMSELKSVNPLFANISPVIEHKVFNNTKLSTPGGGSQFWEKGVIEPDIILKDLIKIIHPDLIKSHELKYYFNLQ